MFRWLEEMLKIVAKGRKCERIVCRARTSNVVGQNGRIIKDVVALAQVDQEDGLKHRLQI
jgi:hypothetical protein